MNENALVAQENRSDATVQESVSNEHSSVYLQSDDSEHELTSPPADQTKNCYNGIMENEYANTLTYM